MDPRALFEVQRLDTAIDQARHALAHLPELAVEKSAAEKLGALRARIGDLMREQGTLESELASIEKRDAEIANHLARLEKQMKTVIAPREAEALQHEMRVLVIERESGDERGLEILDSAATTAEALDEARRLEAESAEALALASVGVRGAEEAARVVIDGLVVERGGDEVDRRLGSAGVRTIADDPRGGGHRRDQARRVWWLPHGHLRQ